MYPNSKNISTQGTFSGPTALVVFEPLVDPVLVCKGIFLTLYFTLSWIMICYSLIRFALSLTGLFEVPSYVRHIFRIFAFVMTCVYIRASFNFGCYNYMTVQDNIGCFNLYMHNPLIGVELNPGPAFYDCRFCGWFTEAELEDWNIDEWIPSQYYVDSRQRNIIDEGAVLCEAMFEESDPELFDMYAVFTVIEIGLNAPYMQEKDQYCVFHVTYTPTEIISPTPSFADLTLFDLFSVDDPFSDFFNRFDAWLDPPIDEVPDAPLVGVEENPGPIPSLASPFKFRRSRDRYGYEAQALFEIDAGEKTRDSIDSLIEVLKELTSKKGININHTINTSVKDTCLSIVGAFSDPFVAVSVLAVALGSMYFYVLKRPTLFSIAKLIAGAVASYAMVNYGSNALFDLIENFHETAFQAESEMLHDSAVIKSILGVMYFSVVRKQISSLNLLNFFRTASDISKTKDGIEFSLTYFKTIIQHFLDFLADYVGTPRFDIVTSNYPEVDKYFEDVAVIVEEFKHGAPFSYANAQRVFALDSKGRFLLRKLPYGHSAKDVRERLDGILKTLKPFIGKFARANIVGNGPRKEPLGILIAGASAVGKSTFMTSLQLQLMGHTLPPDKVVSLRENHNDLILNRIVENEFHDGDHGQVILNHDDLGQQIDVAGNPKNVFMEAIRGINTANWQLHMAHLDDKPNTNFSHEIVSATTNRHHFSDLKSIVNPEAFVRRFEIAYIQHPADKYATLVDHDKKSLWSYRMDMQKVREDFPLDVNDPLTYFVEEAVQFSPYNFITGEVTGPAISAQELIKRCKNILEEKNLKGEMMLKYHEAVKMKVIRERFNVPSTCDAPESHPKCNCNIIEEIIDSKHGEYMRKQLIDLLNQYSLYFAVPYQYLVDICIRFKCWTVESFVKLQKRDDLFNYSVCIPDVAGLPFWEFVASKLLYYGVKFVEGRG